jgi:hypothetical protein
MVLLSNTMLTSYPRLGVGAPIPESSATTRDAARLKHQLIGKGKRRASEDKTSLKPGHQSEEEERRGGTVKKKMKLDPFAGKSKTKGKFDANPATQPTHNPSSPLRQADDSKTGGDDQIQGHDGQSISSSLSASTIDAGSSAKKKKRRKHCATGKEASMSFQEQSIPQSLPQTSQAVTSPDRSGSNQTLFVNPPVPVGNESSSVSFSISGPFSSALQPGELPFLPSQYLNVKQ